LRSLGAYGEVQNGGKRLESHLESKVNIPCEFGGNLSKLIFVETGARGHLGLQVLVNIFTNNNFEMFAVKYDLIIVSKIETAIF